VGNHVGDVQTVQAAALGRVQSTEGVNQSEAEGRLHQVSASSGHHPPEPPVVSATRRQKAWVVPPLWELFVHNEEEPMVPALHDVSVSGAAANHSLLADRALHQPSASATVPQGFNTVAHPILDQRLPLEQRFGYCAEVVLRILCRRHGISTKGGKAAQIEGLVAVYAGRGSEAEAVLTIGSLPCCKEER
jgi:hypothetical protein